MHGLGCAARFAIVDSAARAALPLLSFQKTQAAITPKSPLAFQLAFLQLRIAFFESISHLLVLLPHAPETVRSLPLSIKQHQVCEHATDEVLFCR